MTAQKKIIATVWSGLCNRLFVIASAMRLAEQSQRALEVFWLSRTGRAAIDYAGRQDVVFEDLFEPGTDGLASITYVEEPPSLPDDAVGLDFSCGFELPVGKGIQVSPEVIKTLTSPRILDLADPACQLADELWIHLSTLPVGGVNDGMQAHADYFLPPGIHQKDRFLKSLSEYARRMRPKIEIQEEVRRLVEKMRARAEGAPLIGIHIRGSDGEQRTDVSRPEVLAGILHRLVSNPERKVQIYLASDDPGEIERVFNLTGAESFTPAITMYDNTIKFENSAQGTYAALVDLYTLAECDVIYGTAASSFSLYAWVLSNANFHIHS